MKKIAFLAIAVLMMQGLMAQDSTDVPRKKPTINLQGRANDHFMLQLGYAGWAGAPDSINTGGFSKSFNVYFMFDFPFKTNPKLSIGLGPGISSDHIQFDKTYVGIRETTNTLQFRDQADTNHFKKTKLATVYLEAPVEFRYTADPLNSGKSFKFAIGLRVGTMLKAYTRNKTLQNKNGQALNDYMVKEYQKSYFNTTRLVATGRIGIGHFSLFGSYQITSLFKEGVAAEIRPFSIGLTLSGL
jgi:hypothetical protein